MAIQRINLGTAPSGTGGDTNRSAFKKIDDNFTDSSNAASRQVGTASGNVMEVGAFGLGGISGLTNYNEPFQEAPSAELRRCQFYTHNAQGTTSYGSGIMWASTATYSMHGIIGNSGSATLYHEYTSGGAADAGQRDVQIYKIRTEANTSIDSNGFIKAASPIVKLFADKIELNDEASQQSITFEKVGVGDYLVKGSTGFAQEGWYIEMPKDANGNVLVAVVYEQLDNNDISVKTYAKMFDPDTGDIVPNTARPRDIPLNRWIDLRLEPLPQDATITPYTADETVTTNA